MKTLKNKFIDDLALGSKIRAMYQYDDGKIIFVTFIKDREENAKEFYNISYATSDYAGPYTLDYNDINDDLSIRDLNYKFARITKILEPSAYCTIFENPEKVKLSKEDIENILGYEIEIVEED